MRCDVNTMCYIVFISHSLHWRYIKIALRKYVIMCDISTNVTRNHAISFLSSGGKTFATLTIDILRIYHRKG